MKEEVHVHSDIIKGIETRCHEIEDYHLPCNTPPYKTLVEIGSHNASYTQTPVCPLFIELGLIVLLKYVILFL